MAARARGTSVRPTEGAEGLPGVRLVTPSLPAIQHRQQKMLICRYFKPSDGLELQLCQFERNVREQRLRALTGFLEIVVGHRGAS